MNASPIPSPAKQTDRYPRLWVHYMVVFGIFCGVYAFIFRGLITSIPSILNGDAVLSFDEMVPIFDAKTQFWDQIQGKFSELTNGYEFRVRYSILTTWMRYYKLVPFAIVLSSIGSSYFGFAALVSFLRHLTPDLSPRKLLYASAASVMLFNLILTYSKITHFYTLVLGFNLFFASFLLLLTAAFLKPKHPWRILIAADLVAAINPAVHYIVIYCIVHMIVMLYLVWKSKPKDPVAGTIRRLAYRYKHFSLATLMLAGLTILPYGLATKFFFLHGFENLQDTVPVNYFLIRNTSIPLIKQLSLDITSIMDNYLYGQYSPPYPRIPNFFYFLIGLIPFIPSVKRSLFPMEKQSGLLDCLGILLLLSMWFSLGYTPNAYIPTFHRLLSLLVNSLYEAHGFLANAIVSVCASTIEILRFPHRFQFITFTILMTLLPIGLIHIHAYLSRHLKTLRKFPKWSFGLLLLLFFIPLMSSWSYRNTFLSGDFNDFLTPYPVQDIKEIKGKLDMLPEGKTIVLPPSEAQKRTTDMNGIRHKFIDKFFIYYLNKPSYHFGLSGDVRNKNDFFFMLWAILNNEDWWMSTLQEQDIRYIIISKETGPNRFTTNEYLSNIESILSKNVQNAPIFLEKIFENGGFILYELTSSQTDIPAKEYINLDWTSFRCYKQTVTPNSAVYEMTLDSRNIDPNAASLDIITKNKVKTEMDVYAKLNMSMFFRPNIASLAFNENLIPSSLYFNIIYSMFNVFTLGKYNYLNMIIPGTYDTLTSSFIGLPRKSAIKIPLKVEKEGEYELFLRAMPTRNTLDISVGNQTIPTVVLDNPDTRYIRLRTVRARVQQLVDVSSNSQEELSKRIPRQVIPMNNAYSYTPLGTLTLQPGTHWLYMKKHDDNPLVVEGVLLRPTFTSLRTIPINYIDPKTKK